MTAKPQPAISRLPPGDRPEVKREANKRGARSLLAHNQARRAEVRPVEVSGDELWNQQEAAKARAEAEKLAAPVSPTGALVVGVGTGEAIVTERGEPYDLAHAYLVDTLENPDSIAVEATEQRMRAALDVGVLQSAIDAAVTAGARTSLEKLLCHEIAAAHQAAMTLMARGLDPDLPAVDVARLLNTAARLIDTVQAGQLTLVRARSAGRQHVTVQHQYVQVNDGGQAIVAGQLGPKRSRRAQALNRGRESK
jgi:hypothetical protein